MDITVKQSINVNVNVYVENTYTGNLPQTSLDLTKSIPWSDWIKTWLNTLSLTAELAPDCELSLRLASDRQIQALNQQYRALPQPTDVLAFAATEAEILIPQDLAEPLYLGDMIISLDTAAKQAREQQHSLLVELAWLSSHGLLHLLGWDHPDNDSLQQMLNLQSELIKLLHFEQ